jgi:ATP-dependent helicase/DNAse subunit B
MSSLKVDDSLMEKIRASVYRGHQDEIQAETESVQKYLDSIADEIESLIRADSARARAAAAFNIVRQQAHAQTEIMEGMALRKMLSSCLGFVDTDEDLSYLMEICRQKTGSETVLGSDQVVVTDLRHPVRSADVTYVIGCSEDFYPGFKVRDGLFDEAYTAKIERYPSMGERLDLYRRELAWVSHSARRELIYSMASVDYDGKEKAWYVELDERISDLAKWHLIMRRPMAADPCQIDHDSVQASLMKEGKIVTSVTASERYFSCPMAWFYQDGLRVNQPTPLGLDAASMGTLWHAMMEDAFRNRKTEDGKSYTDWREEEIRDYLDRQFDVLRHLLPGMKVRVDLTEEKMVHHTVILMKWLKDMEDETVYEPKEAELKFREVPVTRDGCVLVNGRIDRVDHFGDHNFRVIDYKSGSDKFSPSRFAAGLQTQLVTYMLIYETMHEEMKPAGAWYCHLNPAVSAGTGAHTAGRGRNMELVLSSFDEAEMREMAYAARKMHGVLLDDVQADGIDETGGTFCVFSRLPEVEDHATMEGMLDEIYRLFYKGVENGSFPAEPVKGACSFCLLKGICRFKGREKNPEVLLKVVK